MIVTVVGCSGSFAGPAGPASCYLVEAADGAGRIWRLLLDCGSGCLGPLQRYVDPTEIDAVVVSHLHADHCLDLCGLYVALKYAPAGRPARRVPVLGPAATRQRLGLAYAAEPAGGREESLDEIFSWGVLHDGEDVAIGPFRLTPRLVEHPVEAYAVRVEAGGAVLAYSGDSDSCPGLVAAAQAADLFLCEASYQDGRDHGRGVHLTGARAGEAAAAAGARHLLLTHIPPWTDAEIVRRAARSAFGGAVGVASPGAVLDVRAAAARA